MEPEDYVPEGREYVPDWAFAPGRVPDEVERTIQAIDSARRTREVIPYGEPRFLDAEEMAIRPPWAAMTMNEFMNARARRGIYTACRKVETVDRVKARRAGL